MGGHLERVGGGAAVGQPPPKSLFLTPESADTSATMKTSTTANQTRPDVYYKYWKLIN